MSDFSSCYGIEFDSQDGNCKACCVAKECNRLKSAPDAKIQQAPLEAFFKAIGDKKKLEFIPRNDGFIAKDGDFVVEVKGGIVSAKNGDNYLLNPCYLLSLEDANEKAKQVV